MVSKHAVPALAGAAALLAAAPIFAQSTPTIVIAFSGAANAVPLDPWSSVAAALFVVLVAATIFRRRLAGGLPHSGLWTAAVATIAAAALGSLAFNAIPVAAAAPNFTLTSSPTNIVIGGGSASIVAQNATGGPITLLSITLANPAPGQGIQTPPTTCVAGLTLASGQTCLIQVQGGKT